MVDAGVGSNVQNTPPCFGTIVGMSVGWILLICVGTSFFLAI
jgi:hypothetical protein